jgi:hypothetical protein
MPTFVDTPAAVLIPTFSNRRRHAERHQRQTRNSSGAGNPVRKTRKTRMMRLAMGSCHCLKRPNGYLLATLNTIRWADNRTGACQGPCVRLMSLLA